MLLLDGHVRLFCVINEMFQLLKTELVVQIVLAKQIKQSKFHYIGLAIEMKRLSKIRPVE